MFDIDWKTLFQNKWLFVIGIIGVVCLLFGSMFGGNASVSTLAHITGSNDSSPETTDSLGNPSNPINSTSTTANSAFSYEKNYDEQLQKILSQIAGIQSVNVMVTVNSTETLQLANNDQTTNSTSKNGSTVTSSTNDNQQIFVERTQDGSSLPVIVQRIEPTIRGVLVTVSAQDFVVAKSEIIDAIQNVLDVPAYKISVEPQKVN